MIPLIAWQIGGPIAGAAIMFGALHLYNEGLRDEGREECRQEAMADLSKQTEEAQKAERKQHEEALAAVEQGKNDLAWINEQMLKKNRAKDRALRNKNQELATLNARLEAVSNSQPDVEVKYVELEKIVEVQTPCIVPDHLVSSIDGNSSMLNTLAHRRLAGDPTAPGELEVHSTGAVTCAQLIQWGDLVSSRYAKSMSDHKRLDDFTMAQVRANQQFHQQVAE